MNLGRVVFLLMLWAISATVLAQGVADPSGLLGAMEDAYERLDYATAELRAREALAGYDLLSADQIVHVHTTLGLLLYARNEPLEAREHFAAALTLDPDLTLDPVLVSPKTLDFFETIRAATDAGERAPTAAAVRYVRVRDLRPAATLRSLAVPGWGQFYKGERTKGWVLAGSWSALAAGTVAAHVARSGARQDYLDATSPTEITERYATFNAWHQTRGALALGAVAVWAYAAFDALAFGGAEADATLALDPSATGMRLTLRIGR